MYRRAVIEAVMTAFAQRDADKVAELVHPQAELRPLPARTVLRGRAEVIAYIESMKQRAAAVRVEAIEELEPDGLLLQGREQWQDADYTLLDMPVVWVIRFRDRLIWQLSVYGSRSEALEGLNSGNP